MLVRGVIVSYETIRKVVCQVRAGYACRLRRRQPRAGDTWHLGEVFLDDQRPSAVSAAARRPGRQRPRTSWSDLVGTPRPPSGSSANSSPNSARLLGCRSPTSSETIGWRIGAVMASVEHRQSQYLNNRAENSHQPTRHRKRAMKRFRTPGAAQRFLAVFSVICPHFRARRHRLTADDYRTEMADASPPGTTSPGRRKPPEPPPRLHPNLPARYSHCTSNCTSNKLTRPDECIHDSFPPQQLLYLQIIGCVRPTRVGSGCGRRSVAAQS